MNSTAMITPPSKILTALEFRAAGEAAAMVAAMPLLANLAPGDGHTVLVLPGFGADDGSTSLLRSLLARLGYQAKPWKLGRNGGPTPYVADGLRSLVKRHASAGPVSIVGWSLGGIYAREIAREAPDAVRQVITLGSPIHMRQGDRSASSYVSDSSETPRYQARTVASEATRPPVPVPTTSVFTRTDGVVRYETCLTPAAPTHENIEVYGSHCGLGMNPSVAYIVADRLRQDAGTWHPFDPPALLRHLYPSVG